MKYNYLLIFASVLGLSMNVDAQDKDQNAPYHAYGTFLGVTAAIRDDKSPAPDHSKDESKDSKSQAHLKRPRPAVVNKNALPIGEDPILQKSFGTIPAKATGVNFNGLNGGNPPDPSGAIGPNHYVQAVNSSFRVYNRNGTGATSPKGLNTLWPGSSNDGDPIVLYDRFADRWVITQFQINNNGVLFAVSTTPDPTGTYNTYSYTFQHFPDYLKFSIWTDGYYMTSNTGGNNGKNVAVFNRDSMLVGAANADMIVMNLPPAATHYGFRSVLPADADGTLPPYGTPNYMFYFQDDAWGGASQDEIKILKMSVDWDTPSNSTISHHQSLSPSPFNSTFQTSWDDIEQPGTTQRIDALASFFNYRAQYLRWGNYNTVMLCNVVDVNNQDKGGIRWYELRQDDATDQFVIHQEGTYAPNDGDSRFLGSIAMDMEGHIGMGYSISGPNTFPSLGYTGRYWWDSPGEMTIQETVAVSGTGSKTGGNRFGDYAHLSLDPNDGTTYWYTGQYMSFNNSRRTRIFSFSTQDVLETPQYKLDEVELKVYQVQNLLKVQMDGIEFTNDLRIDLTEISGKTIRTIMAKVKTNKLDESFDVSSLPQGVYIVAVGGNNFQRTMKIVVN